MALPPGTMLSMRFVLQKLLFVVVLKIVLATCITDSDSLVSLMQVELRSHYHRRENEEDLSIESVLKDIMPQEGSNLMEPTNATSIDVTPSVGARLISTSITKPCGALGCMLNTSVAKTLTPNGNILRNMIGGVAGSHAHPGDGNLVAAGFRAPENDETLKAETGLIKSLAHEKFAAPDVKSGSMQPLTIHQHTSSMLESLSKPAIQVPVARAVLDERQARCVTKHDPLAVSDAAYNVAAVGSACLANADAGQCNDVDTGVYGQYGWCWTRLDKTEWGSCSNSCQSAGDLQ